MKNERNGTERPIGKCLENSWADFNSIIINNKGPIHTLNSSLLSLKSSSYNLPEMWFCIIDTYLLQ